MQTIHAALVAAIAVAALVISPLPAPAGENGSLALTISINGAIGPATANSVNDALAAAGERRAEIVILDLNTSGRTGYAQNVSHVDLRHLSGLHSEPKNEAGLVFPGPVWKKEDHQGRHDID